MRRLWPSSHYSMKQAYFQCFSLSELWLELRPLLLQRFLLVRRISATSCFGNRICIFMCRFSENSAERCVPSGGKPDLSRLVCSSVTPRRSGLTWTWPEWSFGFKSVNMKLFTKHIVNITRESQTAEEGEIKHSKSLRMWEQFRFRISGTAGEENSQGFETGIKNQHLHKITHQLWE